MQFNEIQALINTELQAVVDLIAEQFGTDVEMVKKVSEHITSSGGKKLRPMLALLSAKAFGYDGIHHITIAAIVELIHTATLLHDDVVDHSSLRRGKKTANVLFGNEASVLVGDYLYSRSFQMMVSIDNMRVLEILAHASNVIAEGEVMQLMNCNNPQVSEEDYLETITRKTAMLFSAATELGALISKQNLDMCHDMAAFGTHLGMAFQLIDDALDYGSSSCEIGKNLGDDLAEGKPTLPLIHVMNHGTASERALVEQAINQANPENWSAIRKAILANDSLLYTINKAKEQVSIAVNYLKKLSDSPYKTALACIAKYAIARQY